MKLFISKNLLEKHLDNISRALIANNPYPVLNGIYIDARESNIQLIVSNGNLSIKEIIEFDADSKVIVAGKILVNGRLFKDIIKKQTGTIEITTESNFVNIYSSGSKTAVNLLDINEYPTLNFDSFGKELIINSSDLNNLIKNISFAAAENDKRIILNGVNLRAHKGELVVTATNTYRLAQERIAINSEVDFNITILSKNLRDFFPQNISGELRIKVDDSKVITQYENSIIFSKLIDGVYPDVSKLIPNQFEAEVTINSRHLIDLIDRATVISEENSKIVKLTIDQKEIVIESRRNEIGEATIKSKNFVSNTPYYEIVFNAVFLKDALSRFNGDVKIGFTGQYKAFIVRSEAKPGLVQLILPHRSFN